MKAWEITIKENIGHVYVGNDDELYKVIEKNRGIELVKNDGLEIIMPISKLMKLDFLRAWTKLPFDKAIISGKKIKAEYEGVENLTNLDEFQDVKDVFCDLYQLGNKLSVEVIKNGTWYIDE